MLELTEDTFRALARSSPWRWRRMHLSHETADADRVEAWIDRPDRMRVRTGRRVEDVVEDRGGTPYQAVAYLSASYRDDDTPAAVPPPPTEVPAVFVTPALRPDGLVAVRPERDATGADVAYGDPMWQDYQWVAMLDPVELSHDVALTELTEVTVHDRPAWQALAHPQEGYDPCCSCCPLLWSEVSDRLEYDNPGHRPPAGTAYPDAHRVSLDVQTGIVVALEPIGGRGLAAESWTTRIHEVDGPDPFGRRRFSLRR